MTFILTGCGSRAVYKPLSSDYKAVDSIEGCVFGIPVPFSEKATAITRVTKNGDYDASTLYSYKNGNDQYLMFCMDSFIIIAQKNVDFDFSSGDYLKSVETGTIMGMWLHPIEKADVETGKNEKAGKVVVESIAEITMTDTLYGDFVGKFAYVSNGKDNWAIFCGCPGEKYEELDKERLNVINNVVYSLAPYEKENNVPEYEVVVKGGTVSSNILPATSVSENNNVQTSISQNDVEKEDNIIISNQNENSRITGVPYDSSIYDMLKVGDCGYLYVASEEKGNCVQPIIKVEEIYKNAEDIVKEYCKESVDYSYQGAPIGCHWEAIKYSVDYTGCGELPYINIKLCGVDGETLKYHGIPYEKRTYDIFDNVTEDGTTMLNAICFYAVPNGCEEYVLECGDGTVEMPDIKSAYYYIGK